MFRTAVTIAGETRDISSSVSESPIAKRRQSGPRSVVASARLNWAAASLELLARLGPHRARVLPDLERYEHQREYYADRRDEFCDRSSSMGALVHVCFWLRQPRS